MNIRIPLAGRICLLCSATALAWILGIGVRQFWSEHYMPAARGLGNVNTLAAKYSGWKQAMQRLQPDRLQISLRRSNGGTGHGLETVGSFSLDLAGGTCSVRIQNLDAAVNHYDVWLVDRRSVPDEAARQQQWHTAIHIGQLDQAEGQAILNTSLEGHIPAGFRLDSVVVTRSEQHPSEGGLLFGSLDLFQRLYFSERIERTAALAKNGVADPDRRSADGWQQTLQTLIAPPALAGTPGTPASLQYLIEKGEQLFMTETFGGNGRTCATCHPPTNNFTLDPTFIAGLPKRDPLFVAERDPHLRDLERPALMRAAGLIMENLDGFDKAGVLRGVPHTLALMTSLTPDGIVGSQKVHATGWSGDGAPGSGSLRDFSTGAVIQHFPRSMARVPGEDFRLPSPEELDALEAFQLSLGRQADTDLQTLQLTNIFARRGQRIFQCSEFSRPLECADPEFGTVPSGRCDVCHQNAGANFAFNPGVNANFDTGAERLEGQPGRLLDPSIPCDAGFGDTPAVDDVTPDSPCEDIAIGYGDGTFNVPPVVEAADTGPFFHNNSVRTLEGAISFYNGGEFNNSPGARAIGINGFANAIGLSDADVDNVAAFLRVINALENIRQSIAIGKNALHALKDKRRKNVTHLVEVCYEEVKDATEVLEEAALHFDAVEELRAAETYLERALKSRSRRTKAGLLERAIDRQRSARDLMCAYGEVICQES